MNDDQMDEEAIFTFALEFDDPDQRDGYLRRVCGDNFAMYGRLEALLRADDQARSFLEKPPFLAEGPSGDVEASTESPGTVISRYKLLEQIGEGGFGEVYTAEQQRPVTRKVALKIIKLGMDTKQVVARFEAERQALAMMDHPNIAKVLDGGATDSGRPYFVMELVRGIPITEYCDKNDLTTNERLKLFLDVCRAVQHAHQKGIIHRDIKPTNVMVTLRDGRPMPKVIDFGIAKTTQQRLTEKTLFTEFHQLIGTPQYMSPEQATMADRDVDTRTDIYSLGVLLYELLVGSTPFPAEELREVGYDEICRIIREDEPPAPSHRFSTLSEAATTTVSRHRQAQPAALRRQLRGELDWIVTKAMEKDRTRRYEAATDLAKDVSRYLHHETVEACPPSTTYRLRKFVRRNKTILTTALLVSAALVAGSGLSLWQAREANEARRLADDRLLEANAQQQLAERAAKEAQENEAYSHQLVYAANIRLAAQAWRAGDVRCFTDLLDRYIPTAGRQDLRGFEWRYLRQLGQVNHRTIAQAAVGTCCARHSPRGKYLATGRYDGTLCIWQCPTYARVATGHGHQGLLRGIAFAADEQTVATIGDDGIIRLWDATRWKEVRSFRAHDGLGYGVHFALGGKLLLSFGDDPVIRLWDPATGQQLGTFAQHTDSVQAMDVSPNGSQCVSGDRSGMTIVWDVHTRQPIRRFTHPDCVDYPRCCRFSPDGTQIAVGTSDKLIWLWDSRTGDLLKTFAGHDDDIEDLSFHPSGAMLASSDRAGVIRTWKLDTSEQALRSDPGETIEPADASSPAAGRSAEFGHPRDVSAAGNWPSYLRGHSVRAWSIDFSPDGSRLVSASKDGTVRAWSSRDRLREEWIASACTNGIAFSRAGDQLLVAATSGIRIWSPSTDGLRLLSADFDERALCVAVSPDSATIATGHDEGVVRFWDANTGQMTGSLRAHEHDSVDRIAFSPDGALMATASWDGTAKLWQTDSGKQLAEFSASPHCLDVAFAPDGRALAISWQDNAMLIDVQTRKRVHLLQGHQNTVKCLAFSPGGRWLATGSHDRTIRIWNVRTGEMCHVIAAHRDKISALVVSPDGRTIASGDQQGTVAFSHVETGQFLFDRTVGVHAVVGMAFSPDGETLAVALAGERIALLHAPPMRTGPEGPLALVRASKRKNRSETLKPQHLTEKNSAR